MTSAVPQQVGANSFQQQKLASIAAPAPSVSIDAPSAPIDIMDEKFGVFVKPQNPSEKLKLDLFSTGLQQQLRKQAQDSAAQLEIQKHIKESAEYEAALQSKLAGVQAQYAPPPAAPTSVSMDPAEMYSAMVAGLFGGSPARANNTAYGQAQSRQQIEQVNAENKWKYDQQMLDRQYAMAQGELTREQQFGDKLRMDSINFQQKMQEVQMMDDRQLRSEFYRAKPTDRALIRQDWEARFLDGRTDQEPPSQEAMDEMNRSYAAAELPKRRAEYLGFLKTVATTWGSQDTQAAQTVYNGIVTDFYGGDRATTQQEWDAAVKRAAAAGVPMPPTVQTLKEREMVAAKERLAEAARTGNLRYELAKDKFALDEKKYNESLNYHHTLLEMARERLDLAKSKYDSYAGSLATRQIDSESRKLSNHHSTKIMGLQATLTGLRAELLGTTKAKDKAELNRKIAAAEAEQRYWANAYNEVTENRASAGLDPVGYTPGIDDDEDTGAPDLSGAVGAFATGKNNSGGPAPVQPFRPGKVHKTESGRQVRS